MTKFFFISSLVLLVGCAKDDSKSTASPVPGACSQEIVDAYNDVNVKAQTFNATRDNQDLSAVSTACSRARSLMGEGSCKAENKSSKSIESVSFNDLKAICDEVANKLNGKDPSKQGPKSPDKVPTPPTPTSPQLSSFAKGFTLTVRDADQVERFLRLGVSSIIQAGQSVTKYSLDRKVPYCFLDGRGNDVKLKAGQVLAFPYQEITAGQVVATSEDMKMNIGCANWDKSFWTIQDLKNVFMGLVDVEGVN